MKNICLLLFMCCSYVLNAQTTHIVQRGETFASIASQYGISVEQLQNANPLCEQCYVGLSLFIQKSDIDKVMEERKLMPNDEINDMFQNRCEDAFMMAAGGEFKKAIKVYDQLIEENPNAELYMNRGLCQFERKKWKRAISDLETALSFNELQDSERLEAEAYLEKAKEYRATQLENRANIWSGIAAMAVVTTAAVVQASSAGKQSQISQNSNDYNSNEIFSESVSIEEETTVVETKKECPVCHGAGNTVEYTSTFGISEEKYCDECGKKVAAGHYHRTCSYCSGKGYK